MREEVTPLPHGARLHASTIHVVIAVVLIAFTARAAAYFVDPQPLYLGGLTARQAEMAHNILHHGQWFVINQRALEYLQDEQDRRGHLIDPADLNFAALDRHATYEPEVLEVPGLSIPLAGLWWATGSEHYAPVRWLQIVLDTMMVLLIYWITLRLTRRTVVAVGASLLYALWPGAIILAKTPSLDSWPTFFIISALALFLWARTGRRRIAKLALLGAVVGLGMYFRPFLLLLPAAFAIVDAKRASGRRTLENALVPTFIALVIVAPWTVRNFSNFHRFIPMRIGIGQALWEGLGETPNSFGAVNDDGATISYVHARRPELKWPSPGFDSFLLHRSLDAILHHPFHYLELLVRRALFLLPCLLALAWRRRITAERGLLVAVAVAVILPYVFVRMEDRFWLPAAFAYLILLAIAIDGGLSIRRHAQMRPELAAEGKSRLRR